MLEITFTECKEKSEPSDILNGGLTDYIFRMCYKEHGGWVSGEIMPRTKMLFPAQTTGVRYALSAGETVRVSLASDGRAVILRAENHIARLNEAAHDMLLPALDTELVHYALRELVKLERRFIPKDGCLFAQLLLAATDGGFSPYPVRNAQLTIMLEYSTDTAPDGIGVYTDTGPASLFGASYMNAAALGKLGAATRNLDNVLWLDGKYGRYLVQLGGMNVFFRIGDTVITPPISQLIMHGITRDSAISLMREWGITVEERRLSIDELVKACDDGGLREIFATETRGQVIPVTAIHTEDRVITISAGKLAHKLRETLINIERTTVADNFGWTECV